MESANLDLEENKEIASKFERALGTERSPHNFPKT